MSTGRKIDIIYDGKPVSYLMVFHEGEYHTFKWYDTYIISTTDKELKVTEKRKSGTVDIFKAVEDSVTSADGVNVKTNIADWYLNKSFVVNGASYDKDSVSNIQSAIFNKYMNITAFDNAAISNVYKGKVKYDTDGNNNGADIVEYSIVETINGDEVFYHLYIGVLDKSSYSPKYTGKVVEIGGKTLNLEEDTDDFYFMKAYKNDDTKLLSAEFVGKIVAGTIENKFYSSVEDSNITLEANVASTINMIVTNEEVDNTEDKFTTSIRSVVFEFDGVRTNAYSATTVHDRIVNDVLTNRDEYVTVFSVVNTNGTSKDSERFVVSLSDDDEVKFSFDEKQLTTSKSSDTLKQIVSFPKNKDGLLPDKIMLGDVDITDIPYKDIIHTEENISKVGDEVKEIVYKYNYITPTAATGWSAILTNVLFVAGVAYYYIA